MVVRIAGYAYQRGFGGHYHNDNSVAVLRDIPGLVIASPSHPSDAAAMLETCVASAVTDGSVCAFLEPIARYHTTDLHADGDGGWLAPYEPDPTRHIPIGSARTHGDGTDLTIVTWGNGLFLSLRAQHRLGRDHTLNARVVDLRWLAPLPLDDLMAEANATGRVLVVDETRRSGGAGEGVLAALVEGGFGGSMARVSALDSFVPLGAAANLVLVGEDDVIDAAVTLSARSAG
jgi:2-oxoisovalerate dehydrogenase E1 component